MSRTATIQRFATFGLLCSALPDGSVTARGLQTQTAYRNYPEIPSSWYVTGCCQGAAIADDIQVVPGMEGMQLAEVRMRLYAGGDSPIDMLLGVYHDDVKTGLPGELLGVAGIPAVPPIGFSEVTVDVWSLGIRVPASGTLWIAIYAPSGAAGWNVADAEPTIGTSGNFCARDATGDEEGFYLLYPFDDIDFENLMLTVDVAPAPCPADLNGDSVVDVSDLVMVVVDWGCSDPPGPCVGDINADGVVDVQDLVELIQAWGNCFDV